MPDTAQTIQLVRSFSLTLPPDRAFEVITDAERIAGVVPGATLTSWDGESFAATVRLRLGLVPVVGHGVGRFVLRDAQARRAVVEVARRGGAHLGTVTITVGPDGRHSTVAVHADLVAPRMGRGLVTDLGSRMFTQASTALAASLGGEPVPAAGHAVGVPRLLRQALGRPRAAVAGAVTVTAGVTIGVARHVLRRR